MEVINYKNNKNIKKDISPLIKEAFPFNEVPPLYFIYKRSKEDNVNLLAFYDNHEFIGLAYYCEVDNIIYFSLLAVEKNKRGNRYGEKIIQYLKENNKGKPIVLSYEEVDPKYKNYEQRVKRLSFYKRNGFINIGYISKEFGLNYEVAATDKNLKMDVKKYRKIVSPCLGNLFSKIFIKQG